MRRRGAGGLDMGIGMRRSLLEVRRACCRFHKQVFMNVCM